MGNFKELYNADIARYNGEISGYLKKFHYWFRKTQCTNNQLLKAIYHKILLQICKKNGFDFDYPVKVGKGIYIGHEYGITINDDVIIGENCNLHKGVTIGRENRGKRKGTPIIGDCVWIGINAAIVGNISIGNDVLIAPNSFVNIDVPSHSIVMGNPAIIKHSDHATESYILNKT